MDAIKLASNFKSYLNVNTLHDRFFKTMMEKPNISRGCLMANLPGTYQVRAIIITAYNQRIESNATTVVVKAGTEITQHPESMSTYVNKTNYLQVLAAGDELSYRWEYRLSGRETKEWQSDSNDNTTGNTLKVSANQIQVRQY